jgi:energy-coupling factor transporter ATP-binding protein EcfA2
MTTKEDKIKAIRNIEKEEDIHTLLYEILPELGFKDVYITHERGNKSERGKDLICSFEDVVEGKKDWIAFVVKKGVVAGKSLVIQDIIAQTKDCFEFEYKDIIKGLRIRINKVKIVTNRHFSSEAERNIGENNNFDKANIAFWDEEKLIQLIDKHYPKYWLKGSKSYKKYVDRFTESIKVESLSKSIGISDKKIQKILECAIEPRMLERVENDDGTFQWKSKSTNSIVNLENNSIIIGEPGAGKSTLFKSLSKEIIEQNSLRNDTEFYPIILTFQDLRTTTFDLEKSVIDYFKKEWNSDLMIDGKKVLEARSCVIFIDALDELPQKEQKEAALKTINDFYSKYPEIKIICSSRPSDYLFYNCSELGFKYLEINPVDRKQVESFLNAYFADNLVKSQRLLKSLKDTGILEKLPKTPMTIALITILFDEKEIEIPATITDLYRQFVDLLLGKYTPESTVEIIEIGIKHRLLCYIAKGLHTSTKQSISLIDLKSLILAYSKERGQSFDIELILEDLITNSGLLFQNEKEEIQFKHLSFQEYFTAYEIFHHRQTETELFTKKFNNLWWQNVAIFYAGMTKDAPGILENIISESVPVTFAEMLTNTAGMGKLLQALYNTSIESRMSGITRGVDNTENAIKFLLSTEDKSFDIWKNFSKYGIMQIIGGLFSFSYWSITLVEPLKQQFEKLITEIDNERTEDEQFYFEFKLFLICTILASDNFVSFKEFRELVEKTKSNDLSLFAIMHTHLKKLEKHLTDKNKEDKDFEKIEKKITKKKRDLGKIADIVNSPIEKLLK